MAEKEETGKKPNPFAYISQIHQLANAGASGSQGLNAIITSSIAALEPQAQTQMASYVASTTGLAKTTTTTTTTASTTSTLSEPNHSSPSVAAAASEDSHLSPPETAAFNIYQEPHSSSPSQPQSMPTPSIPELPPFVHGDLLTARKLNHSIFSTLNSPICSICALQVSHHYCECKPTVARKAGTRRYRRQQPDTGEGAPTAPDPYASQTGGWHQIPIDDSESSQWYCGELQRQVSSTIDNYPSFRHDMCNSELLAQYDLNTITGVPLYPSASPIGVNADGTSEVTSISVCHPCWASVSRKNVPKFAPWNGLLVANSLPNVLQQPLEILSAFRVFSPVVKLSSTLVNGESVKSIVGLGSIGVIGDGTVPPVMTAPGLLDSGNHSSIGLCFTPGSFSVKAPETTTAATLRDIQDYLLAHNIMYRNICNQVQASNTLPDPLLVPVTVGNGKSSQPDIYTHVPLTSFVESEATGQELYSAFLEVFPFASGGFHEDRPVNIGWSSYWSWMFRKTSSLAAMNSRLISHVYSISVGKEIVSSMLRSMGKKMMDPTQEDAVSAVDIRTFYSWLAFGGSDSTFPASLAGKEEKLSAFRSILSMPHAGSALEKRNVLSVGVDSVVDAGTIGGMLTLSPGTRHGGHVFVETFSPLLKTLAGDLDVAKPRSQSRREASLLDPTAHARHGELIRQKTSDALLGPEGFLASEAALSVMEATSALRNHSHTLLLGLGPEMAWENSISCHAYVFVLKTVLCDLDPSGFGLYDPAVQWLPCPCPGSDELPHICVLKDPADLSTAHASNSNPMNPVAAVLVCALDSTPILSSSAARNFLVVLMKRLAAVNVIPAVELSFEAVMDALNEGSTLFGSLESLSSLSWALWVVAVGVFTESHNHGPWCSKNGVKKLDQCRFRQPSCVFDEHSSTASRAPGAPFSSPFNYNRAHAGFEWTTSFVPAVSAASVGTASDFQVLDSPAAGMTYLSKASGLAVEYVGKTETDAAGVLQAMDAVSEPLAARLEKGLPVSLFGIGMMIARRTALAGYPLSTPLASLVLQGGDIVKYQRNVKKKQGVIEKVFLPVRGAIAWVIGSSEADDFSKLTEMDAMLGETAGDDQGHGNVIGEGTSAGALRLKRLSLYLARPSKYEEFSWRRFFRLNYVSTAPRSNKAERLQQHLLPESLQDVDLWVHARKTPALILCSFSSFPFVPETAINSSSLSWAQMQAITSRLLVFSAFRDRPSVAGLRLRVSTASSLISGPAEIRSLIVLRARAVFCDKMMGSFWHPEDVSAFERYASHAQPSVSSQNHDVVMAMLDQAQRARGAEESGKSGSKLAMADPGTSLDAADVGESVVRTAGLDTSNITNAEDITALLCFQNLSHGTGTTAMLLAGSSASPLRNALAAVLVEETRSSLPSHLLDSPWRQHGPKTDPALFSVKHVKSVPANRFGLAGELDNIVTLDPTQQSIVDRLTDSAMIGKQELIFLTGEAGSGKSFVTQKLQGMYYRLGVKVSLFGTTGVAASLIGGSTLHSKDGLRCGRFPDVGMIASSLWDVLCRRPQTEELVLIPSDNSWGDVVIVDEASQMSPVMLLLFHIQGCLYRSRWDKPFGGITFLLVGDPLQCPPVQSLPLWELYLSPRGDNELSIEQARALLTSIVTSAAAQTTSDAGVDWKHQMNSSAVLFGLFTVHSLVVNHRVCDLPWQSAMLAARNGSPQLLVEALHSRRSSGLSVASIQETKKLWIAELDKGRGTTVLVGLNDDRASVSELLSMSASKLSADNEGSEMMGWKIAGKLSAAPGTNVDVRSSQLLEQLAEHGGSGLCVEGLAIRMSVFRGQRVQYTSENLNANAGIANGSEGFVLGLFEDGEWTEPTRGDSNELVVVDSSKVIMLIFFPSASAFPWPEGSDLDGRVWPVSPIRTRGSVRGLRVVLKQLPIFRATAGTCWKNQGKNLGGTVIGSILDGKSTGKEEWARMYVSVSRARSSTAVVSLVPIPPVKWSLQSSGAVWLKNVQQSATEGSWNPRLRACSGVLVQAQDSHKRTRSRIGDGRQKRSKKW